ncbi:RNA polymerase sigma factor, partial [Thermodesulfobacteriota bacterium]
AMEQTQEMLVDQARDGDKQALEALVRAIQDQVYGLAIRMLFHPADAEDATQEILIKVITNLGGFRRESAFTTWVYRVASNHLLTARKTRAERMGRMTFKDFDENIDRMCTAAPPPDGDAEQSLIAQDIMISCVQGVLQCLDRDHRIAYILGEISEITSEQGAAILDISPVAFRKRHSRARARIRDFMGKKCGLVNPDSPCRCSRFVKWSAAAGGDRAGGLLFAGLPCRTKSEFVTREQLQQMGELQRVVALFRSCPDYAAPEAFVEQIRALVDAGRLEPGGA